jgi:hypothetical protein
MHHDCKERERGVIIVIGSVVQLELCREDHAVAQFFEAPDVLKILKTFQVQGKDVGRALDPNRFVSLLQTAALVAVELVRLVKGLYPREVAEAACDGGVLLDLQGEVEKCFVT